MARDGRCCYWLSLNRKEGDVYIQGRQCLARCNYTMPVEDDGNRYRKYEPFCPEHTAIVAARPKEDDDV